MMTFKNRIVRGLAVLMGCFVLLGVIPVPKAYAEPSVNYCNLIIVARFADDSADAYNLVYDTGYSTVHNWKTLKEMFGSGTADHSTKAFLYAVSQGGVVLNNYFPQDQGSMVLPFTFAYEKSHYANMGAGYEMVKEVITAIQNGTIPWDSTMKPDYRETGWLDNLTLIVQGDSNADRNSAIYPHHGYYEGNDCLPGGIYVGDYNVMDSESLIPTDATGMYDLRGKQSTISHELLHSFGFPDLYRYNLNDAGDPVGTWDIMAHTTNQWQTFPLTYDRQQAGFIPQMQTISQAGTYHLNAASSSGGTVGWILKSPLSDKEFFVAEYRVKGDPYQEEFDAKIPSTGLVLYRVDSRYDTNREGQNYLYVFRQNPTSVGGAAEENPQYAVLTPGQAESYGSTDLSADYAQNTLYYSDGSNSGIQISNVKQDGEQIAFDVSMADYSSVDFWQDAGTLLSGNLQNPSLLSVGTELYLAADQESAGVVVQHSSGGDWAQLGQLVEDLSSARLGQAADGTILLTGCKDGKQTMYRYDAVSAKWIQLWQDTIDCSGAANFASDGNETYLSYVTIAGDTQSICVKKADDGTDALSPMSAPGALYSPPSLCYKNGQWYLIVVTLVSDPTSQPTVYCYQEGAWTAVHTFGGKNASLTSLCVSGQKMYALAAGNQNTPALAVWDGTQWTNEALPGAPTAMEDLCLVGTDGEPILVCSASMANTAAAWQKKDSTWQQLGANITTGATDVDATLMGDIVYMAVSGESTWMLRKYALTKAETPEPPPENPQPVENYTVAVTPPAGYTDAHLYIDGVEYAASVSDGQYSVTLASGSAKTAILYSYNASGVPVGMSVWLLSYANSAYKAAWQPELENLLSYHGFSVRVTGQSGIRFKTGIQQTTKQQLAAGAISGWKLNEYGTMVMRDSKRATLPFVLGGTGVKSGRAYWTDGAIHDSVFESVSGRDRFTSVLIGLPAAEYKTEFAFRGYIILEKDGAKYTFYGPIVARSIYTVAGQLVARGEFASGTSADRFLRKLRADADALD